MDTGIIHEFTHVIEDLQEGKVQEVYWKGQFFSSTMLAFLILLSCGVSLFLVLKNAKMKFSFEIIGLITASCIGTLVFQFIWTRGHQNKLEVALFGLAIFMMQLFVPISIKFTKRQWTLLKRYQIRQCNSIERLKSLTKESVLLKWGFQALLYSSLVCMAAYATMTAIYSHYAIHVAPCSEHLADCPKLQTALVIIRGLQVCMYLAYSICAVLMCLFAYKMHKTIKETYENWETSYWEIFLHCFALVFPVIILSAILITGRGNILEQNRDQAIKNGD